MQRHSKTLTNHKTLMMFFAISSALALTSCTTIMTLQELDSNPQLEKTLISDTLIAYGYAQTPIPEHENALIIVGKKYNYLIEVTHSENHSILKDIATQLDLDALMLFHPNPAVIYKDDTTNTFNYSLGISFKKSAAQISEQEKQRLAQLEFGCFEATTTEPYSCLRNVSYKLSPIKKTNQDSLLQHTLKSPISLKLKTHRSEAINTLSKAPYVLLLPITVVVDIVTLPIQYAVFKKAFTEGRH